MQLNLRIMWIRFAKLSLIYVAWKDENMWTHYVYISSSTTLKKNYKKEKVTIVLLYIKEYKFFGWLFHYYSLLTKHNFHIKVGFQFFIVKK
jgi:hypothetical protein